MSTNFPTSYDDNTSLPVKSSGEQITAAETNTQSEALKAMQTAYGIPGDTVTTTHDYKIQRLVDAAYVVVTASATLSNETVLGTGVIMKGTIGSRPAAGTNGRMYWASDTTRLYRDTGSAWDLVGALALADLTGTVVTAQIGAAQVTYAKVQNVATARLLGRVTAGSGAMEEIPLGAGLAFSSGSLINTAASAATTHTAPLDYIIFKEGGTYKGRNVRTGVTNQITTSTTDAALVINAAFAVAGVSQVAYMDDMNVLTKITVPSRKALIAFGTAGPNRNSMKPHLTAVSGFTSTATPMIEAGGVGAVLYGVMADAGQYAQCAVKNIYDEFGVHECSFLGGASRTFWTSVGGRVHLKHMDLDGNGLPSVAVADISGPDAIGHQFRFVGGAAGAPVALFSGQHAQFSDGHITGNDNIGPATIIVDGDRNTLTGIFADTTGVGADGVNSLWQIEGNGNKLMGCGTMNPNATTAGGGTGSSNLIKFKKTGANCKGNQVFGFSNVKGGNNVDAVRLFTFRGSTDAIPGNLDNFYGTIIMASGVANCAAVSDWTFAGTEPVSFLAYILGPTPTKASQWP